MGDESPEHVWKALKVDYVAILEERRWSRERTVRRLENLEATFQDYRDRQSELWNRHAMAREDWMLAAEHEQRRGVKLERRLQKWNQCRFAKEDNLTRQRREESERQ